MYQVVVAEDELWIRKAMVEMIERSNLGFKVVGEAADGEEAWALVNEMWPMVLITDVRMPNRDGLWVVRNIYEHKLPIIPLIISGYDDFEYARQAVRYQVSEYLLKPVNTEELESALKRSLERLAYLNDTHLHCLKIQTFVDHMMEMDPKKLITEQTALVRSICRIKDVHPGVRSNLLRMLSTKLSGLLDLSNGDGILPYPFTSEMEREVEVVRYFHNLAETWIREFQKKGDYRMKHAVKQACEYMNNNYMHEITLKQIADQAGLSFAYFSTIFKQYTGEAVVGYLNKIRIEQARLLLLETDIKIYEIAEMAGFPSLHYFNRVFKAISGMTPNEYRRSIGL
ncbi:putative response regulatory protein [compost metagenome]